MEDSTLLFGRQWVVSQNDSSILTLSSKIPAIENENATDAARRLNINYRVTNIIAGCIGIGQLLKVVFSKTKRKL